MRQASDWDMWRPMSTLRRLLRSERGDLTMEPQQSANGVRLVPAQPALGRNPKVADDPARRSHPPLRSFEAISEMHQPEIQFCAWLEARGSSHCYAADRVS